MPISSRIKNGIFIHQANTPQLNVYTTWRPAETCTKSHACDRVCITWFHSCGLKKQNKNPVLIKLSKLCVRWCYISQRREHGELVGLLERFCINLRVKIVYIAHVCACTCVCSCIDMCKRSEAFPWSLVLKSAFLIIYLICTLRKI